MIGYSKPRWRISAFITTGADSRSLPLANQIPASLRSHSCRVHCSRGNVAAASAVVSLRAPIHRQSHLSTQNDVRCLRCVRVIRVRGSRTVLPNISVRESFAFQLLRQLVFVHFPILTTNQSLSRAGFSFTSFTSFPSFISLPKTAAPFPRRWGLPRKGHAVFRREARAY